jgi:simple sugar transport system substrate-binding protein
MRRAAISRLVPITLLGFLASARDRDAGRHQDTTPAAPAADRKPPPFDAAPVKVALVQYSGAGDYFEQWTNGARIVSSTPRSRPTPT